MIDRILGRYPGIQLAGTTSSGEMSSVLGFSEDPSPRPFAWTRIDIVAGIGRNVLDDRSLRVGRPSRTPVPGPALAEPVYRDDDGRPSGGLDHPGRPPRGPGACAPILGGGAAPRDPADDPAWDARASRSPATSSPGTPSRSCCSAGRWPCSYARRHGLAWRRAAGDGHAHLGRSVVEIDGRPALEFYERYLGTVAPAIANPLAVFDAAARIGSTCGPRSPRPGDGQRRLLRRVPGRREGAAHGRRDRRDLRRRPSIDRRCAGAFPAGRAGCGADLLVRHAPVPPRDAHRSGGRGGPRSSARDAGAGFYCLGEIAPIVDGDLSQFHNATMVTVLLGAGERRGAGAGQSDRARASTSTARTGSSTAACGGWRRTAPAGGVPGLQLRRSSRSSSRTSRRSGRGRSGSCSTCSRSDHRPARSGRDPDRRPPRRRDVLFSDFVGFTAISSSCRRPS